MENVTSADINGLVDIVSAFVTYLPVRTQHLVCRTPRGRAAELGEIAGRGGVAGENEPPIPQLRAVFETR
jgi:hypothetical protein